MMQKLFVDYDGVIVNTIKCICEMYDAEFRNHPKYQQVSWSEISSWDFYELDCATPEYIDTYFESPNFFKLIEFMPWAEYILGQLNTYYDIKIISMGNSNNLTLKEEWCYKHIPYAEFIGMDFAEHTDKSAYDMKDGVFIDDVAQNLKTSNAQKLICFGSKYPWNKEWEGARCANWFAVWKMIGQPKLKQKKLVYG